MNWNIQLFELNFNSKEAKAASDVVKDGWLSMGEKILSFEREFSNFLDIDVYCSAVSSCTAALHMALLALDIKENDEVIIPALTFIADANVVKIVGAKPVLADSASLDNWNVSLDTISRAYSNKTKAIIVVHFAGYPIQDINEIRKFCNKKKIALIEDTAHAPGASINGKQCGTIGDIGCFSFYSNKNLSIGEGGMVSTQSKNLAQKLGFLRSHGMTSLTLDRHKGRAITYDVDQPGLNYRMDEIRAAIGSVQLEKLPAGNARRKDLTNRYRSNLAQSLVKIPFETQSESLNSVYHILPVLLPKGTDRVEVIGLLKQAGIQSSIHYPPFWDFSAYRGQFLPSETPITAEICRRQLTLPLFPTMTEQEVDKVCNALLEALA